MVKHRHNVAHVVTVCTVNSFGYRCMAPMDISQDHGDAEAENDACVSITHAAEEHRPAQVLVRT